MKEYKRQCVDWFSSQHQVLIIAGASYWAHDNRCASTSYIVKIIILGKNHGNLFLTQYQTLG